MITYESKLSNEIATMRKLKMVNCYELFGKDGPISGVMAYYEDKTINLCNVDDCYLELLDQVARVYAREHKQRNIVADEHTLQVLKSMSSNTVSSYEKRLKGFLEQETPIFPPKGYYHVWVLPVVKYVLAMLYGDKEDAITFQNEQRNWFGEGVMCAVSHGAVKHLLYRITALDDDTYDIRITNAFKQGNHFTMELNFGNDGIVASFRDEIYQYRGDLIVEVTKEHANLSSTIWEKDKTIAVVSEELEREREGAMPTELATGLCADHELPWVTYRMPWGDTIYRAMEKETDYFIYESKREFLSVSYGTVTRRVTVGGKGTVNFGDLAFRLYEQERDKELHLLEMAYPRSTTYYLKYAGKYYTK